jgi:DNA-binding Xre family transcriptional regulator
MIDTQLRDIFERKVKNLRAGLRLIEERKLATEEVSRIEMEFRTLSSECWQLEAEYGDLVRAEAEKPEVNEDTPKAKAYNW